MDPLFMALKAAAGRGGSKLFSSVPYAGTGGLTGLNVGVDAANGAVTILRNRSTYEQGVWDTVRGAAAKADFAAPEAIEAAFGFSGLFRAFTGATKNAIGTNYASWNFAKLAGFLDIVTFNGGSGAVNHGLGVVPAAILYFRRTGLTSITAGVMIPGVPLLDISTQTQYTSSGDGVTATTTTFTPNSTFFTAGTTWVAIVLGSLPGRLAVGSYVGTQTFGTAHSQNVTLPFSPSWGLFLGGIADPTSFPNELFGDFYDLKLTPKFLGAVSSVTAHNYSITGTTLTASGVVGPPARSSAATGRTYRYIIVK